MKTLAALILLLSLAACGVDGEPTPPGNAPQDLLPSTPQGTTET